MKLAIAIATVSALMAAPLASAASVSALADPTASINLCSGIFSVCLDPKGDCAASWDLVFSGGRVCRSSAIPEDCRQVVTPVGGGASCDQGNNYAYVFLCQACAPSTYVVCAEDFETYTQTCRVYGMEPVEELLRSIYIGDVSLP